MRDASNRYQQRKRKNRPARLCECGRKLRGRQRVCPSCRSQRSREYFISECDRAWIYKRDGHHCLNCGGDENLTIDHILPRALGGQDDRSNYQTLCAPCNASKGATYVDYRPNATGQLSFVLTQPKPSLRERFIAKVDKQPDGCWLWTGALFAGITPAMRVNGHSITAAQVAWSQFNGEDANAKLFRTCQQTLCVNPDHLTTRRIVSYGTPRDECRNGHPYDHSQPLHPDGSRRCRTCRQTNQRAWYVKKQRQARDKQTT